MIDQNMLKSLFQDYTPDNNGAVLVAYHKKGEMGAVYCSGYSNDLLALTTESVRKLANNMGMQPQVLLHMMGEVINAVTAKEQKEPMQ